MRLFSVWLFKRVTQTLEDVPSPLRLVCATGTQIGLVLLANLSAFVIRFETQIPDEYWHWALRGLPFIAGIYALSFWTFGIQRGLWRYVGFHDLKLIVSASMLSAVVSYLVLHVGLGWTAYPRSVLIMTGLLSIIFLGGVRMAVRIIREWAAAVTTTTTRVLIVGAGNAGEMLARDLRMNPEYKYESAVFVDDNPIKQRRTIHGIPVEGMIENIPSLVRQYAAQEIVVAIPSAPPALMQRVLASATACHMPIKILPNVRQILNSPISLRQVRPMRLEDLLQRDPIQTDLQELHPLLEGKRVLVTGAGGSIGSELCRQIAQYSPALLVLFERYENNLHTLELELQESFPQIEIRGVVGDVTDMQGVREAFRSCAPKLIFHAAAHKHVPLMERNIREAVRNNIVGTRIVAEAALEAGVQRLVLISTDKAVNPTNVMGATKRIAEYLVQNLSQREGTQFTVVRFGNVLGSNGSVVPLFAEQIKKGGPVTVTHPEIKRYFMTIPEAVQLILQASVRGQGGDVFVLDMGEQIRILDLAKNMIALSGLVPERDVKISFTGLRPGEKLYEELFEKVEQIEPTSHEKIKRAVSRMPCGADELNLHLTELEAYLAHADSGVILRKLQAMVPTYLPSDPDRALHKQ
jgi:FlaA1/EpsC-like NDP-sugar epimerase